MFTGETKIIIALLAAGGVLGIFFIYFIYTILGYQKKNNQLHAEKLEAEIRTLEKERKRLSANLHDDMGPVLASVKMRLGNIEPASNEDAELLKDVSLQLDRLLLQIREITHNLSPAALERKGLFAAVKEFAAKINETGTFKIHLTLPSVDPGIKADNATDIFRIIQEAIYNCIKHSGAAEMVIEIRAMQPDLILQISDNGKGFSYNEVLREKDGLGLKNILSRTELMKGTVYIKSELNKGVYYEIIIPVL